MAKIHGKSTRVYVGPYDWSCGINQIDIGNDRDVTEVTTFCDTAKAYVTGLVGHTIEQSGYGVFAAADVDETVQTQYALGTSEEVSIYNGTALGDRAFISQATISGVPRTFSITDAVGLNASWVSDNLAEGEVLSAATSLTSTGALTGTSFRALGTSDTVVLIVHLTAVAGSFGSFAAKLEHSTDSTNGTDGAWADVGTVATGSMTALGSVRSAEVPGGTVGPWFRLNVTDLTTLTGATVQAAMGALVT